MYALVLAAAVGFNPWASGPVQTQAYQLNSSMAVIAKGQAPNAPRAVAFAVASGPQGSYFVTERNFVLYGSDFGILLQAPWRHWVPARVVSTGGNLDVALVETPEPWVQPVPLSTGDLRTYCYAEGMRAYERFTRSRCYVALPDPWNTTPEFDGGIPTARVEGFFQNGAYLTLAGPVPRAIPGSPLLDYDSGLVIGMVAERQANGDVTAVPLASMQPLFAGAHINLQDVALR